MGHLRKQKNKTKKLFKKKDKDNLIKFFGTIFAITALDKFTDMK